VSVGTCSRSIDSTLITDGPSGSLNDAFHANHDLMQVSHWGLIAGGLAVVLLDISWFSRRRPKPARVAGPPYVELPLGWTIPHWLRLSLAAVFVAAVVASIHDPITSTTPLVAYPDARRFAMAGSWLWAAFWVLVTLRPILADRAHDRRAEWSVWYRQHLSAGVPSSPLVSPVTSPALAVGEPAGTWWVLRTAGLVVALIFSMVITIAGVSEFLVGQYGRESLPWLLGSLVVDGLVGWAFARRYQTAKRSRSVPPTPF
jgi:hypothetical protein